MNPLGLLMIGAGGFTIAGAACNWDWFMNARKARLMVRVLTRDGARVFYSLLGLFLVVLGVLTAMGIIEPSP